MKICVKCGAHVTGRFCSECGKETTDAIPFIDGMDGHEFEYFCADLLRKNGFTNVDVTPGSGDQGVDILAKKEGKRYAIQCKCYSSPLGNGPVQEVYAGMKFYSCDIGIVMTNSVFTKGGVDLARRTGVQLWDRAVVQSLMQPKGMVAIEKEQRKAEKRVARDAFLWKVAKWLWRLVFLELVIAVIVCTLAAINPDLFR